MERAVWLVPHSVRSEERAPGKPEGDRNGSPSGSARPQYDEMTVLLAMSLVLS
jgi:hypothetical protein